MKNQILKWGLAVLLLGTAMWDIHRHRYVLAASTNRTPYDRSKYFTKAARSAFVFVSRYTVTDASLNHTIRIENIDAADSEGHTYWETHVFNPGTDTRAASDSAGLIETSTGKIVGGFWRSKEQEDAGVPVMVPFGQNMKFVRPHTMPANNCTAPEPQLKFLRYESVTIGDRQLPTAVVEDTEDGKFDTVSWLSMTPALGCLELKSVTNFTNQENVRGSTIREPVSLTLGEPESRLTDVTAKLADKQLELVPVENWDTAVKAALKKYKPQQ